jgi:uncharacterized protein
MVLKKDFLFVYIALLAFWIAGCSNSVTDNGIAWQQTKFPTTNATLTTVPARIDLDATPLVISDISEPSSTPISTISPTNTPTPTPTDIVYEIGAELTIESLRELEITGSEITFEEKLADRSNYHQNLVSYISEGNKIYGLLTIPFGEPPKGGYKAIVFNHGYIPPMIYQTTEKYTAYVDYLARSGFVVFKIDYQGHGKSEGEAMGSYFSPGYTIDAISALKSLQTLDIVDPHGIGMWGHSMAGNLIVRAMLIEGDIQAAVIWAGAVYSYDDFMTYRISDSTYQTPEPVQNDDDPDPRRRTREIFETYGWPDTNVEFWKAVSLTENVAYLIQPIQIHHAEDDTVVNIGYSFDLAAVLQENEKPYEFYTYEGGGHNLISPYFDQAMLRTVEFFKNNL